MSQIVLHRDGIDPDFSYRKRLDLDLSQFLGEYFCYLCRTILSLYSWVGSKVLVSFIWLEILWGLLILSWCLKCQSYVTYLQHTKLFLIFFFCVFLSRTDDSKQWFVKQLTQLPQYWHPILVTGMYLFLLVGWTKTFEKFLTSQYLLFISMNALLIFCCTMRCVHFKAYWEHLLHLNYKQSGFFQFFFFFFLAFLYLCGVYVCEWMCGVCTGVHVGKCR